MIARLFQQGDSVIALCEILGNRAWGITLYPYRPASQTFRLSCPIANCNPSKGRIISSKHHARIRMVESIADPGTMARSGRQPIYLQARGECKLW